MYVRMTPATQMQDIRMYVVCHAYVKVYVLFAVHIPQAQLKLSKYVCMCVCVYVS